MGWRRCLRRLRSGSSRKTTEAAKKFDRHSIAWDVGRDVTERALAGLPERDQATRW
jgi:hypothetical protein